MFYLYLIITTVFLCYIYLKHFYQYWAKKGVPNPEVNLFFGNLANAVYMKEQLGQIYTKIYRQFPNVPYVGIYKMRTPCLLLREPNLIKDIYIKDFDSFSANDIDICKDDTLAGKNPFCQWGDEWKKTRAMLNPCYTASKIKGMFPLIQHVSKTLISYVTDQKLEALEAKELCTKFTIDVVATCAFGLEGQSFTNAEADFKKMGQKIFQPSTAVALKFLLIFIAPAFSKLINLKFIADDIANYFRHIISSTLSYRKQNNVVRDDFLKTMLELKEKHQDFTDEDVTAHALGFFIDGFETSASTMSFILYLLGKNKNEQTKLRQEINTALAKNNNELTYDLVQEMQYLECVFQESFRVYPVVHFLTRKCTKRYELPPVDPKRSNKPTIVEPGTPIIFPFYGLSNDELYFSNPSKFDPERFNSENKQTIPKGVFTVFGEGPKSCLGQRFGSMQVKLGVLNIIKNFEVSVSSKTKEPIEMDPKSFINTAKGGLWLNFRKI